ncbi:MAG TPA: hypothetical protein VGB53_07320 [Rubricoccaceae bacterium]
MSAHFAAVNGAPTYTVTSSAPDVATVTLAASRLTIRPRNPGTARIIVTASTGASGEGQQATQTFTVETLDPCPPGPAAGQQDLFPATQGAV